jgi:hypothetical protein
MTGETGHVIRNTVPPHPVNRPAVHAAVKSSTASTALTRPADAEATHVRRIWQPRVDAVRCALLPMEQTGQAAQGRKPIWRAQMTGLRRGFGPYGLQETGNELDCEVPFGGYGRRRRRTAIIGADRPIAWEATCPQAPITGGARSTLDDNWPVSGGARR